MLSQRIKEPCKDCELWKRWPTYVIDRGDHISSASAISPASIVPFSLPEPGVDVINCAFAADETLKVLFHL